MFQYRCFSTDLQDSSMYSSRSLQYCGLYILDLSSNPQFLIFFPSSHIIFCGSHFSPSRAKSCFPFMLVCCFHGELFHFYLTITYAHYSPILINFCLNIISLYGIFLCCYFIRFYFSLGFPFLVIVRSFHVHVT